MTLNMPAPFARKIESTGGICGKRPVKRPPLQVEEIVEVRADGSLAQFDDRPQVIERVPLAPDSRLPAFTKVE